MLPTPQFGQIVDNYINIQGFTMSDIWMIFELHTTAASSHAQQSEQKETFTLSLLARGMSTIEAQFFWKNIVIGSDFRDRWVI